MTLLCVWQDDKRANHDSLPVKTIISLITETRLYQIIIALFFGYYNYFFVFSMYSLQMCPLLLESRSFFKVWCFMCRNCNKCILVDNFTDCTPCLKNVPPLACYNFDRHERIWISFGRNVTSTVSNQKILYYATSNNLCFCTACQNGETQKLHFSLKCCISALPEFN